MSYTPANTFKRAITEGLETATEELRTITPSDIRQYLGGGYRITFDQYKIRFASSNGNFDGSVSINHYYIDDKSLVADRLAAILAMLGYNL